MRLFVEISIEKQQYTYTYRRDVVENRQFRLCPVGRQDHTLFDSANFQYKSNEISRNVEYTKIRSKKPQWCRVKINVFCFTVCYI